jgi:hypothetical protein
MALGWLRVDSVLRLAAGQVLRAANRKTVLAQKAVFRGVTLARMRGEAVEVRLVFDRRQMHSGQLAQLARAWHHLEPLVAEVQVQVGFVTRCSDTGRNRPRPRLVGLLKEAGPAVEVALIVRAPAVLMTVEVAGVLVV